MRSTPNRLPVSRVLVLQFLVFTVPRLELQSENNFDVSRRELRSENNFDVPRLELRSETSFSLDDCFEG